MCRFRHVNPYDLCTNLYAENSLHLGIVPPKDYVSAVLPSNNLSIIELVLFGSRALVPYDTLTTLTLAHERGPRGVLDEKVDFADN